MGDVAPVLALRVASVVLSAALVGTAMTWPVLVLPALSDASGFSSRDRFHFWESYHRRVTPINSLLLPLLTVTLSLSALFAPSLVDLGSTIDGGSGGIVGIVRSSRKSLFIVAAILTLAHRPYNFTFLVPRREVLFEYERTHVTTTMYGVAGLCPSRDDLVDKEYREDKLRDYDSYGGLGSNEKTLLRTGRAPSADVDTDDIIEELTRFEFGPVVLSGLTFFLALLEISCV